MSQISPSLYHILSSPIIFGPCCTAQPIGVEVWYVLGKDHLVTERYINIAMWGSIYDLYIIRAYHILLHAYILRTMVYQHESLQAAVGPPESPTPPQSTVFHQNQDQFPEKMPIWGGLPLPNHHFPRFPLSSIIWSNTSRSQVYAMVFTTCHISDNFPRNKLSSFYLPHQSAGPQLWISFYLCFLVRHILYPSDVIT